MARANVVISLQNEQFIAAAKASAGAWGELQAKLSIGVEGAIKDFDKFDAKWNQGLGRVGKSMMDFGQTAFFYVTLPIAGIGAAAFKAYGDIEALELGMRSLEPTVEMATLRLKELFSMSKAPGGAFEELVGADLLLRNTGLSAEMATRTTKGFMNALALVGKGKTDFMWVTKALSQISARGLVQGDEINQLSERLPQIKKLLKDAFGTADTEVLKKMGVSSDDFFNRIVPLLEKMPKAMGGFRNATDNVIDGLKIFGASIGEMFDKGLGLTEKLNWATDALTGMAAVIKDLPTPVKTLLSGVVALGAALPLVIGGIGALASLNSFFIKGALLIEPFTSGLKTLLFQTGILGLSIGGWLALGAAVAYVGKEIYDHNTRFNETNALIESNNAIQSVQTKLYSDQAVKMQLLLKTAQNERLEMDARKDALKRFNEGLGETNQKLAIEDVNTKKATETWERYSKMLLIATQIKARFAEVDRLVSKQIELEQQYDANPNSFLDAIDEMSAFMKGHDNLGKSLTNIDFRGKKAKENFDAQLKILTSQINGSLKRIPTLFDDGKNVDKNFQDYYNQMFGVSALEKFKGAGGKDKVKEVYEGIRDYLAGVKPLQIANFLELGDPNQKSLFDAVKQNLIGDLGMEGDANFIRDFYDKMLKNADPKKIIDEVLDPNFSKQVADRMNEKLANIPITFSANFSGGFSQMNPFGTGTNQQASIFRILKSMGLDDETINKAMQKGNEKLVEAYLKINEEFSEMKSKLPEDISFMAADLAGGFAEIVGSIALGENGIRNAGASLLQTLGGMIKGMGQKILQMYVQKAILDKIKAAIEKSNGISSLFGGSAGAGGLIGFGMIALSALMAGIASRSGSNSKRNFANGSMLFGRTEFVGGEYAGASHNPEVVAPLDRLKSLMGNGGSDGGLVELRIKGEDLVLLMNRAGRRMGGR